MTILTFSWIYEKSMSFNHHINPTYLHFVYTVTSCHMKTTLISLLIYLCFNSKIYILYYIDMPSRKIKKKSRHEAYFISNVYLMHDKFHDVMRQSLLIFPSESRCALYFSHAKCEMMYELIIREGIIL